jgi:hypothetical protein
MVPKINTNVACRRVARHRRSAPDRIQNTQHDGIVGQLILISVRDNQHAPPQHTAARYQAMFTPRTSQATAFGA